jgi:hypothetical protein
MQVKCTSCGAEIAARDVNLDRLLAKCATCNAVFDISRLVPRPAGGAPGVRTRRPVEMPKRIRILTDDLVPATDAYRASASPTTHFVVERGWFTPSLIFLVFFCCIWDGFLFIWYGSLVQHGLHGGGIVAFVFPIFHVTAGAVVTYTTVCGFVNRTRISIESGNLVVRHGPLPWPGNRTIPTEDLTQLYCEENIGSKGSRSYSLNAMTKSSTKKISLLASLPDAEQVLYLEQLLEQRLGLVDVPVAGEFV